MEVFLYILYRHLILNLTVLTTLSTKKVYKKKWVIKNVRGFQCIFKKKRGAKKTRQLLAILIKVYFSGFFYIYI